MTHDHGLIPLKLVHFDDGVNVTMGLPIVRTSVDHGTAYDIAGLGRANVDATELSGYLEYRQPTGSNAGRLYARLARLAVGQSKPGRLVAAKSYGAHAVTSLVIASSF